MTQVTDNENSDYIEYPGTGTGTEYIFMNSIILESLNFVFRIFLFKISFLSS